MLTAKSTASTRLLVKEVLLMVIIISLHLSHTGFTKLLGRGSRLISVQLKALKYSKYVREKVR